MTIVNSILINENKCLIMPVHKFIIGGYGIIATSETEAINQYKKLRQGMV